MPFLLEAFFVLIGAIAVAAWLTVWLNKPSDKD